jgi:pilus assembly protein CpaE
MKQMKITIISPNKSLMEGIRRVLLEENPQRAFYLFDGTLDKAVNIINLINKEQPDVVILDESGVDAKDLAALEQVCMQYPNTGFIMLNETVSQEFLISALRIGVKDVLKLPLVNEELLRAVHRVESKSNYAAATKQGKVIVVTSGKGGSGATFLACNLGYILAATHSDIKVALLDLNLQFGDAALFLSDHVPPNTLADVAGNISRLDASLLSSSMVQILPNFGVLAAPEDAERAVEVKPQHIDTLIKLAKRQYDFVILDIGRSLNSSSLKALDHADNIFLVLQQTLPFIRDSKRLIKILLSLGYPKAKINLLINRYEKASDIDVRDVEATLEMQVYERIPNSYAAVSASVNQGVPIMKISRHDVVTKSLEDIAEKLTEIQGARETGWLSKLFR